MPAFETSEYRARLDRVRSLMSEAETDALLVISEGSLCYLTGYEAFSDSVPQALLVTLNDDPYLILRESDLQNCPGAVWLPEGHVIGYDESYVGSAERSAWTAIGEFVKGKVMPSARIGAEISKIGRSAAIGALEYPKLVGALGLRELRDRSRLVSTCRRVKSESELAYMTEAARIVDHAMLAGIDKIAVGTPQADVAATIMSALISGTENTPGGSPVTPWMHVGEVANAPHLKWSDERYAAGQQTNFEFAAFRHRYACALARTAYLGSPPPRLSEISKAVIEAWHSAFEMIRPGVACSDVARAVGAVLGRWGIKKESRCGYSIGIDWMDGGASLAIHDHTEIVPNMTFHVLVGIWNRDEGYNFSETVRVTDNGAASLSAVPRVLFERPA